jgi:autotransporter-associated beta strand protein
MIPVVPKRRPLALSLARFTSFAAFTTALSIASGSAAHAASVTWDGEVTSAWSNALNWSSDTLPTAILPGDDLIFSGPTAPRPATIDLGADRIANSLSFTADGFSLGNLGTGNSLTISSGNVSVASGVRATLNASLAGTSGLNKSGNGTLALQNVSAYTGTVAISGGSIVALNNGAFGASANGISLNGGTLRFYNQTNSANPPNNFGSGHGRVSRFINIGTGGGTIDVPSQNIIAFDNVNAFTGTGTLTKTGIGEFQIVNSNNFAGNLMVAPSGGSMWVRASGKLTNVAGITVNTGGTFVIDNQNGVGPFASVNDNDRLADSIPVTLLGGTLSMTARNSTTAGQSAETVGKVTLGQGRASSVRIGAAGMARTLRSAISSGNLGTSSVSPAPTWGRRATTRGPSFRSSTTLQRRRARRQAQIRPVSSADGLSTIAVILRTIQVARTESKVRPTRR